MSTIVTVRPFSASTFNRATLVGAADRAAATNDNSDASYVDLINTSPQTSPSFTKSRMGNPAPVAGATIISVTPRFRINSQGNGENGYMYQALYLGSASGPTFGQEYFSGTGGSGFVTLTGIKHTTQPDGSAWTAAAVQDIYLEVGRAVVSSGFPGYGTAQRVSEVYLDVEYNYPPTPTGTTPNANSGVARPTFGHSYADTDSDAQQQYRYKVYSVTQYTAGGFDPNVTVPVVDSGWLAGTATSWQCTTDLTNGLIYRAFIFVNDGYQNNVVTSAGPYAFTTIAISPPAVPDMTITPNQTGKFNTLVLAGRENMLQEDSANFENGIGQWVSASGTTTVSRATTQARDGTYSFTTTAASAGQLLAASNPTSFLDNYIVAGRVYSAAIYGRANTTTRTCRMRLQWYDAANALISSVVSYDISNNNTRFTPLIVTGTAPGNAVTCRILVEVDAAAIGEIFFWDQAMIVPYAINTLDNPLMYDTNADSFADQWTTYFVGAPAITQYQADSSAGNVIGGINSQKTVWINAATYVGQSQTQDYLKSGQPYTLSVWVKVAVACTINLYVGISTNPTNNTVLVANTWTRISLTFTPGVDRTTAYDIFVRADASSGGNTLWVGHVQLEIGSTVSGEVSNPHGWTRGGLITPSRFEVQRSTDQVTWTTITRLFYGSQTVSESDYRNVNYGDRDQMLTTVDYEAPLGVPVYYRVRSVALVGTNTITSQWSFWRVATTLTLDPLKWYLKVPENPLLNYAFAIKGTENNGGGWTRKRPEAAAFFNPIGRNRKIKVRDVIFGSEFTVIISAILKADTTAFGLIRAAQRTMLLQSPDGRQWYCEFDTVIEHLEIVTDPTLPYVEIPLPMVEVDAP